MWQKSLGVAIALGLLGSALADYIVDREAAMALYNARRYEDALVAFGKMAAGEVSDVQKSDALRQAVNCAYRLKQNDKAMELARDIPIEAESKAARLVLLSWTRKWKEAIAEFKSEDIAAWPDHVKHEAYRERGMSAYRMKEAELAVADLTEAAKYARNNNDWSLILCNLGDVYRSLIKDDEKALEVYRRVLEGKHLYKGSRACLSMADIYLRQGKPEEALKALDWVDLGKLSGLYKALILAGRARVLASMGKKDEAIAKYKEALAVEGLASYTKKNCEKALKELQGDEKRVQK